MMSFGSPPILSPVFPMFLAKNPSQSRRICPRDWFRDLLWSAFPAPSDSDRAKQISAALGVSKRQAQHWLACDHDAALRHVLAVLIIAGAESAFAKIGGRE